jgi:Regulator of ribonuclease activity B
MATPAADPSSVRIDNPTPNQLSREDAAALIGVLATLEGELLAGHDNDLWNRLASGLHDQGLLPPKIGHRAGLRIVLANLNERLRYALGEYNDLPEPADGLADHHVRFDTEARATAFVQAMEGIGLQARTYTPTNPDSEAYLVMVTTGEPVLSPGFEHRDEQIRDAAQQVGGFYEGWGGDAPPSLL